VQGEMTSPNGGRHRAADQLLMLIGRDAYNFGRLPMPLPLTRADAAMKKLFQESLSECGLTLTFTPVFSAKVLIITYPLIRSPEPRGRSRRPRRSCTASGPR
jgi:hypothetical protein